MKINGIEYTTDLNEKKRIVREHIKALSSSKVTISTNMGEMPIWDYLDCIVRPYDFDSYKDMLLGAQALAPNPADPFKTPRAYHGFTININKFVKQQQEYKKQQRKSRGR